MNGPGDTHTVNSSPELNLNFLLDTPMPPLFHCHHVEWGKKVQCWVSFISYITQRGQNSPLNVVSYRGHAVWCARPLGGVVVEMFPFSSILQSTLGIPLTYYQPLHFSVQSDEDWKIQFQGKRWQLEKIDRIVFVAVSHCLRCWGFGGFALFCRVFLCQAKMEIDIKIQHLSSFG